MQPFKPPHVPFKFGGGDDPDDHVQLSSTGRSRPAPAQGSIRRGKKPTPAMAGRIQAFRARLFLTHVEEAKDWIERMIGRTIPIPIAPDFDPSDPRSPSYDFLDVLKTSEHLALLGNSIRDLLPPPDNRRHRVHERIGQRVLGLPRDEVSPLIFGRCMDNFQMFQRVAVLAGLESYSLCTFEDLYERRNVTVVIRMIHTLAHLLSRRGLLAQDKKIRDFVGGMTETVKSRIQFSEAQIHKIEDDFARVEETGQKLCLDFGPSDKSVGDDDSVVSVQGEDEGEAEVEPVKVLSPLTFAEEDHVCVLVRDQKAVVLINSEEEEIAPMICVEDDVFEDVTVTRVSPSVLSLSFCLSDDDVPDDVDSVKLVVRRGESEFIQREYRVEPAVVWHPDVSSETVLPKKVPKRLRFTDNRWKGEGVMLGEVKVGDVSVSVMSEDGSVVNSDQVRSRILLEEGKHQGMVELTAVAVEDGMKVTVCFLDPDSEGEILLSHELEIRPALGWLGVATDDGADVLVGGHSVDLEFVDRREIRTPLVGRVLDEDGKVSDRFGIHLEEADDTSAHRGRFRISCPMDIDAGQMTVQLFSVDDPDVVLQRSYLVIPPIEFSSSYQLPNSLLKGATEMLPYSDSRSLGPSRGGLRGVIVLPDGTIVRNAVEIRSGDYSGEIAVTCPDLKIPTDGKMKLRVFEDGRDHDGFLLEREFSVLDAVTLESPDGGLPAILTSEETYVVRILDRRGPNAPEINALAEVGDEMILCDVRDVEGVEGLKEVVFVAEGTGELVLDIFASLSEAEPEAEDEFGEEELGGGGSHIHLSRQIQAQFDLDPDALNRPCFLNVPFELVIHDRGDATVPKSALIRDSDSEDSADVATTGNRHVVTFTQRKLGEFQVILRDAATGSDLVGVALECVPVIECLDKDVLNSLVALVPATFRIRDNRSSAGPATGSAEFICCFQKRGVKPKACPLKDLGNGIFVTRMMIPTAEPHTVFFLDKRSKTPLFRHEVTPSPAIDVVEDLPPVLISGTLYAFRIRDIRPKRTTLVPKMTSVDLLDDVEIPCDISGENQDVTISLEATGRGPFRFVVIDGDSADSRIILKREVTIRPELEFVKVDQIPRLCLLGKTYEVEIRDNRDPLRQRERDLRAILLKSGKDLGGAYASVEDSEDADEGLKVLKFTCPEKGRLEIRVVEDIPGHDALPVPLLSKTLMASPPVQLVSHFPEQVLAGHGHQHMLTFLDARPPESELLSAELFLDSRKVHPCCSFVEEGQVRNKFSLYFTCPTSGDGEVRLLGEGGIVVYRQVFESEDPPEDDPKFKVEYINASQNNVEFMAHGVGDPKYIALVLRSEEEFNDAHQQHIVDTFKSHMLRVCKRENFRVFCEDGSPSSLLDIIRPSNLVKDEEVLREFVQHMNAHFRFRVIANGVQNIVISDRPIRVEEWRTEDQDLLMPTIRDAPRPSPSSPAARGGDASASKVFGSLFVKNPNQQGVHRRLFNWNFWVQLFHKVAAAKKSPHEFLDDQSLIVRHVTEDVDLRVYRHADASLGARKADLLAYGNLILETAQHMIFTIIREASAKQPSLKDSMSRMCKGLFTLMQESYQAFRFTLERTMYLNARTLLAEVPESDKAKVRDLVESFTTEYLVLMKTINMEVAKALTPQQMADSLTLKLTLKELAPAFAHVRASVLSSRERKILVQELIMRNPPQSPTPTSTCFPISIPINHHFDKAMFPNKTNLCTDDDPTAGLRNPWKCAYVRGSNVAFECVRSASIRCEEFPKTEDNAVTLLRVLAANHCQRFARAELVALRTRGLPLQVPVVILSVMTPFYVNREDRDVVEMQEALIRQARAVTEITADLHDKEPPITVKVEFQGPFLLNIGTNATLKTFQMGIGIQRMLNFRKFGIRSFELCVQEYIREIRARRYTLRAHLETWLEQNLFRSARDGGIYRSSLAQRLHALNSAHVVMQQLDSDLSSRIAIEEKKLAALQQKLERLMHEHWFPNLATPTKLEYRFRTSGLKGTVKALLRTYNRIYNLESEYFEKWKNERAWESQFLKELNTIFTTVVRPPNFFKEYHDLGVLSGDLTSLFSDLRFLFWKRKHESFTVSLLERSQVQQYDPYDIPVRLVLLAFKLGYQVHVCSRRGGMRVSEVINQALEYTEMRWHFGSFPTVLQSTEDFHNFRKAIHAGLALNGNNMDLQRLNYGVFGSSSDGATAGRFGDSARYRKYLGFGYLKGTRFASRPDAFRRFKELYARGRSALGGQ